MDSKLKCVFENPLNTPTKTAPDAASVKNDVNSPNDDDNAAGDSIATSPKVNQQLLF